MLVIPGRAGSTNEGPCLKEALARQLSTRVYVVHRIDRHTSGVVVMALNPESHRVASMAFERGEVTKQYLALVVGRLEAPVDIDLPLIEGRKGRMKVARPGTGKPSRTLVRPVAQFDQATLVECEPRSGRQHQIRVHLAVIGHPLWVDPQYGSDVALHERALGGQDDQVVLSRTPLHAWRLKFATLSFSAEAQLPSDMKRALELLKAPAERLGSEE